MICSALSLAPCVQGVPYDLLGGVPFQGLLGLQALRPSQVCRVSLMICSAGLLPRPLGATSPELGPGAQGVPYDPLEGVWKKSWGILRPPDPFPQSSARKNAFRKGCPHPLETSRSTF